MFPQDTEIRASRFGFTWRWCRASSSHSFGVRFGAFIGSGSGMRLWYGFPGLWKFASMLFNALIGSMNPLSTATGAVLEKGRRVDADWGWSLDRHDAQNEGRRERSNRSAAGLPMSRCPIHNGRIRLCLFIKHSMRAPTGNLLAARARWGSSQPFTASPSTVHGRAAAYRRLSTISFTSRASAPQRQLTSQNPQASAFLFLRSDFLPQDVLFRTSSTYARHFHSRSTLFQQAQKRAEGSVRDKEPEPEWSTKESTSSDGAEAGEKPGEQAKEGEEQDKKAGEEESGEQKQGDEEGEKGKKKDAPPPPPHGDKTPWQVFTETLKSEFKASKEWNESTKQLSAGVNDFTQNPHLQKARSTYNQVTDAATSKTAEALKTTGRAIGHSAAWTWETTPVKGVRKAASATGSGLEYVTRPVRKSKAFQAVKETVDDGSSSRYGGWVEKEERKRRRELRELNELQKSGGKNPAAPLEEDPDAGTNVTLHKDAKYKEIWREFKDSSRLMQGLFNLQSAYKESDNPLVSTARSISDRITGFFAENETAMVIKKFREMDPNFQLEPFLTEMREYILPEVLDAYVRGDVETLKLWLSAAQYSVYAALMQQYTTAGLKSDGRIVDIRHVDILSARLLEPGEIPVFIITCRTQEVHVYRNAKSGELAAGMDDKVQQVTYAIGVTRIPEDVNNPETRGWRLIELQKSARDYY
ncbi:Tim44-domain-containing protein [Zopfia rhizophila CBS 207.26]|uniref:Mitochondrial import inner membrane translocase subunit TIM44 n=1 Tax=Zopfia rhizophila CBS 207.26 TaxID=1314779 RepID=A0A6A6DVA0_9PEZI|nr:Tim44-domain-containing protein [Zopfia rhizophila CBS 207.26]